MDKSYAFVKHPGGSYVSLYGDKLKRTTFWTKEDLAANKVFESDIPLTTKVLRDIYLDEDDQSEGHRELIIDIEVESNNGFPNIAKANNVITSIAIYDQAMNQYFVFVLGTIQGYKKENVTVETFLSEEELLQRFYQVYTEIQPTIITGWNSVNFDIPYLYNRTMRILDTSIASSLSPIGEVFYNDRKGQYVIAGVSQLDYLALYKKFTYIERPSYRLDSIGQFEVGIGKVEYDGTLDELYEKDIEKFIEYNLNDVKIVKALDDKLKLIELVRGIAHVGHIPYEDIYYSSRYLEGALLVYLKKMKIIAPNKPANISKEVERFVGAWVKNPVPGRYDWVYDLDVTSMYPSIIMSLNISPETKIGKLVGWNAEEFIKGTPKTYTFNRDNKKEVMLNDGELRELFNNNKVSVSSNGVLYKNDKRGLIPAILEKWFDDRTEYKQLMKKFSDEGDKDKSEYFKRRQHIQKIVLNSLYGVLGLPVFRFYDVDNAEAVTTVGQKLIKFTEKMVNFYYNKELDDNKDHVTYCDTDSVFCSAVPLVKHRNPNFNINDNEYMTKKVLSVATEVQDFLNKSYDMFAKNFLNIDDHRFNIKQEVISRASFWVTKKRYGQWIINDGGVECNRLDVKGLDIVRSSFPPAFRDLMIGVLKDILNNEKKENIDKMIMDFKKSMKTLPIEDIALPIGVKGIDKYSSKGNGKFTVTKKGAPVHVKASIKYNDMLRLFGLTNKYRVVRNRDKIKWVYLKPNPYSFEAIAFKGHDDPEEIMKFIRDYIHLDKIFKGQLQKKIDMFYGAMKWESPVDVETSLMRFF